MVDVFYDLVRMVESLPAELFILIFQGLIRICAVKVHSGRIFFVAAVGTADSQRKSVLIFLKHRIQSVAEMCFIGETYVSNVAAVGNIVPLILYAFILKQLQQLRAQLFNFFRFQRA